MSLKRLKKLIAATIGYLVSLKKEGYVSSATRIYQQERLKKVTIDSLACFSELNKSTLELITAKPKLMKRSAP